VSGVPAAGPDAAWASAAEIAGAVAGGRVSAAAMCAETLARIAGRDKVFNAFTAVTAERARRTADAIDAARAEGEPLDRPFEPTLPTLDRVGNPAASILSFTATGMP
jgi:hypothetical protein